MYQRYNCHGGPLFEWPWLSSLFQGQPWLFVPVHGSTREIYNLHMPGHPKSTRSKPSELGAQDWTTGGGILCTLLHRKAKHGTGLTGGTVMLSQNPTPDLPRCKLSHNKPLVLNEVA